MYDKPMIDDIIKHQIKITMVQRKKSTKEQEVKTEATKGKGKSPKKERKIEKADLSVQNEETVLPEAGKEEVTPKENSECSIDELLENLCPDTDCEEDEDCNNEEYGDEYDEIIKQFDRELEKTDEHLSKTERFLEELERKRKEQEAWVDEFLNEEY